ncbi:RING-type domain-containing protein [Mycena venus]|uniref:RING-type domain-containing protein n=1 Tax=Mycena venus TaxID=2733690 RepID=A0A8H6XYQ0_9AGAR|nr:RING-type domain-containing protein [Mycena venus]
MPATCSICLEPFNFPVSLPCGHIFCRECIRRTVDSLKSCSIQHFCPACRAPYSVLTVDPVLVPPYLRPHILPPIRQVFLDDPAPTPTPTPSAAAPVASSTPRSTPAAAACASGSTSAPASSPASGELGRALAEVNALRMHCATWQRRAEVQAAANTNLLELVRAAKGCALRIRAERDAARSQGVLLKRKLVELMPENLDIVSESPFTKRTRVGKHDEETAKAVPMVPGPRRAGLPVYLLQCKPHAQFYDDPADMDKSHFGSPLTRRTPRRGTCGPVDAAPIARTAVPVPDSAVDPKRKAGPCGASAGRVSESAPLPKLLTVVR